MTRSATMKDTPKPTPNEVHSRLVRGVGILSILRICISACPIITGIARKKEYSAAATVDRPHAQPPIIVEAERDIPGTMERTWKRPTVSACLGLIVMSSKEVCNNRF